MITPRQLKNGVLLVLMAGCATQPATTGTKPVATGPRALIHASYTGGLLDRQAEAVFKLEESAYVMVAHLGGDGRLDVLFPEDARESGRVSGGKWFRTPTISAYYDAAPQLYSFAMNTFRTAGAQLDSYDGRGYGFLFLVASKRPLRFDLISEFGLWDDLATQDYRSTIDPRTTIKALAERLAGGSEYTIKFARSTSTTAMTTYADYMFDCAMLSQYAFSSFISPFSYPFGSFHTFGSTGFGFNNGFGYGSGLGYGGGCGRSASTYAYVPTFRFAPTAGPTPPSTPTPRDRPLMRPPHRRLGEPRPGLAFANPTRRNSPDNPAPAPRDWAGILRDNGTWGPMLGAGRRTSSGSSGSSGSGARRTAGSAASTGTRAAPTPSRTPTPRPASSSKPTSGAKQ